MFSLTRGALFLQCVNVQTSLARGHNQRTLTSIANALPLLILVTPLQASVAAQRTEKENLYVIAILVPGAQHSLITTILTDWEDITLHIQQQSFLLDHMQNEAKKLKEQRPQQGTYNGIIASTRNAVSLAAIPEAHSGHDTASQRSRLVRADDTSRTESLHGAQVANQSVLLHELVHTNRQSDGHTGRQTLLLSQKQKGALDVSTK